VKDKEIKISKEAGRKREDTEKRKKDKELKLRIMGQVLDLENPSFSQTFYQAEAVSCVLINDRQERVVPGHLSAHCKPQVQAGLDGE